MFTLALLLGECYDTYGLLKCKRQRKPIIIKIIILVISFVFAIYLKDLCRQDKVSKIFQREMADYTSNALSNLPIKDPIYLGSRSSIEQNIMMLELIQKFPDIQIDYFFVQKSPSSMFRVLIEGTQEEKDLNQKTLIDGMLAKGLPLKDATYKYDTSKQRWFYLEQMFNINKKEDGTRFRFYDFWTTETTNQNMFYEKLNKYQGLESRRVKRLPYKDGTYVVIYDSKRKEYYVMMQLDSKQPENGMEDINKMSGKMIILPKYGEKPLKEADLARIDNGEFLAFIKSVK
jgi:hypothetical protein